MNDRDMRELLELTRENNRLLRKIRRSSMISTIIWIIWYGILIGGPVFIYYYLLQPYIGVLLETYGNSVNDFHDIINKIPVFQYFIGGQN